MAKIPVSNTTAMPIYVGAAMIPAGETRHFDEEDVPAHLRPVPEAIEPAAPTDPLLELLEGNVASITAALTELSDADLARLEQAEHDGKARKGVLVAISEVRLQRAAMDGSDA